MDHHQYLQAVFSENVTLGELRHSEWPHCELSHQGSPRSDAVNDLCWRGRRSIQGRREDERGGATLELAIIAPIFVLFIVGIVDLGRILMHHLILTQVAYEGARVASTLTTLADSGANGVTSEWRAPGISNPIYYPAAPPQSHQVIHERLRQLFEIHRNELDLALVESNIRPSQYLTVHPFPHPNGRDIRVRVCGFYNGLFPAYFNNVRICAEAVGPYLNNS